MKTIKHVIHCRQGEVITLAPIGDIQYTGRDHAVSSKLTKHLKRCQDLNAYYFGTGDYVDFASPSNRLRIGHADLYDNAQQIIDDTAKRLVQGVYEDYLKPTAGRWLGMVSGHHYYSYSDGSGSTDTDLADLLHCPLTESLMVIRVLFVSEDERRTGHVDVWVHHGSGSGTASAIETKLRKQAQHWPCDVFVQGHTTSRFARPIPRMKLFFERSEPVWRDQDIWLISAGGWSRAYQEGLTDYVERGAMPPTALGAPLITIIPEWRGRHFTPTLRGEA